MVFQWFRTRNAQVIHRREAALDRERQLAGAQEAWAKLLKRVSDVELALRNLEEHHSTTVSHLNKLRGQVHGPRGVAKQYSDDAGSIPFGDKEALRRRAGIVHGQRFVHPEEKE